MIDIASGLTEIGDTLVQSCLSPLETTNTTWIVQNCNGKVALCIGNDCNNPPYSNNLLCEINNYQLLSSHDA